VAAASSKVRLIYAILRYDIILYAILGYIGYISYCAAKCTRVYDSYTNVNLNTTHLRTGMIAEWLGIMKKGMRAGVIKSCSTVPNLIFSCYILSWAFHNTISDKRKSIILAKKTTSMIGLQV